MTRHLRRLPILMLAALVLATPLPVLAGEPFLGDAVSLPDGTVLPPMPAEQVTRTVQSQMLEEHGGTVVDPADGSLAGPLVAVSYTHLTLPTICSV